MSNNSPDLRFGPGTSVGFTPAGVAAFDDLRPAAVVRELIQNALDAARAVGVAPAIVRFCTTQIYSNKIPGIESYKSAFDKALKTQEKMTGGTLAGQANLVAKKIEGALESEQLEVLSVLDNGIGLNKQRMNALLSDGLSVKHGGATGTYGNGHSTVIPASDLRYILYGGIIKSGHKIGAGHAVLASHIEKGEQHLRAGDGFYIRNFRNRDLRPGEALFDYVTGPDLPKLIAEALDRIKTESKQGTAVIIPAFNNFLEKRSLWDMVSQAASANFFVAIEKGDLVVKVEENGKESKVLEKSTLGEILKNHQGNRRARAFLNGRRAFEAHQAYQRGKKYPFRTKAGKIEIRLFEKPNDTTRIDLCRNGMWITDMTRVLSNKFVDQVPFHAILSLNAQDGKSLHEFIRMAEVPLHDDIRIKRLPQVEREKCRAALQEIEKHILKNTTKIDSDTYSPDDYLTLDFGEEDGREHGKSRNAFWGMPVPINRSPSRQLQLFSITEPSKEPPKPIQGGKGSSPPNRNRTRQRPSLPTFFQAVSRPAGEGRRRILIECEKSLADAELRLVVDEALDATCERPNQDPYTPAVLSNVMMNGKPTTDKDLIRRDNDVIGIRLGDLSEGALVEIETDYSLGGDFIDLTNPSLRIEVFKTEQKASTSTESHAGSEE